jgi:hypothetical protein
MLVRTEEKVMEAEALLESSRRRNGSYVLTPSQAQELAELASQTQPAEGLTVEQKVRLAFFASRPNFVVYPNEASSSVEVLQTTINYLLTGQVPEGALASW